MFITAKRNNMKRLFNLNLLLIFSTIMMAQIPKVSSGHIERHTNFQSEYVDARNVDVWLPEGYSSNRQYAVLYMHDGQMLFDASSTWNKQEWAVDEHLSTLIKEGRVRDCIVVGIWNNGEYRHAEYFPQRAWDNLSDQEKEGLASKDLYVKETMLNKGLLADKYLKFIVQELKPFIDSHYSTFQSKENTFIMGSSMGGLISLYAISEYPGVFGGAGCLSTHWPAINGATLKYVADNLPDPKTHRIYFDYGTETLDADYEPYQLQVDQMMEERGYVRGNTYLSLKFQGADHTENAWSNRLNQPLEYLLK